MQYCHMLGLTFNVTARVKGKLALTTDNAHGADMLRRRFAERRTETIPAFLTRGPDFNGQESRVLTPMYFDKTGFFFTESL